MFDVVDAASFPTESLDVIAPEDLVEELAAVLVRRDRIEARAAQLLARANQSRAFERDGYTSLTALLKHRMSLHPGEAQRLVRRANALVEMPLTALAYERGAISGAQVDVLAEIRAIAPDQFAGAEGELVELAMDTPLVKELRKKLDYWLDQVAPDDQAFDRNLVRELRSLTLRRDGEMMRINGWFDIESGARLAAGLDPGPPAEDDTRSAPARRADILLDILEGTSERPNISVLVSAQTLLDGRPGISETVVGTYLSPDEMSRISCDANLTRVVFGPDSQPLDVGRTRRLVTPAQRVAVIARDRECVFPTCDRNQHWCDVHHIIFWTDGGPTDIENLVLLCRYHHTLVHDAGWKLTGTPGHLHFHRPDGTRLGDPPPKTSYRSPIITPDPGPATTHTEFKAALAQIHAIPYPRGP